MTGLSGAGKSTIAAAFERRMTDEGYHTVMLDGDAMRTGLCAGLGFSPEDRRENLRRIAEAAKLLAMSGAVCVVCVISPDRASREEARRIISPVAPFWEVYVSAPLEVCAKRDPKGLYRRAFRGEISQFTGVSAPYEEPEEPDLVLDSAGESVETCVNALFHAAVEEIYQPRRLLCEMIGAGLEAAERIMAVYRREDTVVAYKADHSPLTEADTAAHAVISRRLRTAYPEYELLSEEGEEPLDRHGIPRRLNGMGVFLVDPLDGTKEFLRKNGEFCVSIAFSSRHRVMGGVIVVPEKDWVYYAFEGRGAYKLERASKQFEKERFVVGLGKRLSVSERTKGLIVTASRSHGDEETERLLQKNADRIARVITVGSCLKGCLIAEGAADVHYRFGSFMKEWDTAGMEIICREAGALFLGQDGRTLPANRADVTNRDGFVILNHRDSRLAF